MKSQPPIHATGNARRRPKHPAPVERLEARNLLTVSVAAANDVPTLTTLEMPATVNEGGSVTVHGTFTDADAGDAHTVTVHWGDEMDPTVLQFPASDSTTHEFRTSHPVQDDDPPGTPQDVRTIRISVSDGTESSVATRTLTVVNLNPTASAGPDKSAAEGTAVTLNGVATDPSREALTRRWTAADARGNVVAVGNDAAFTFTPPDDGVYTLTFTAADDDGGFASDTALVTASNVAPTLQVTALPTADEGKPYSVRLAATDPGADAISSWVVAWGDRTSDTYPVSATTASHVYTGGIRQAALWVRATDEDGTWIASPPGAKPGSVDTAFGTGGSVSSAAVGDVALQGDGKLVAVWGGEPELRPPWRVLRFNADGTPDAAFGTGGFTADGPPGDGVIMAVALQADGKIVVAGYSFGMQGEIPALMRYNPDGSRDTAFGVNGYVAAPVGTGIYDKFDDLAVLPDGKILAGGHAAFGTDPVQHDAFLARFNPDGSPDTTYGTNGRTANVDFERQLPNRMWELAVLPDGRAVFAGEAFLAGPLAMLRVTPTGQLDPTFGTGGKVTSPFGFSGLSGQALAALPDGSVYVAGASRLPGSTSVGYAIARFRPDGTPDPAFSGDGVAALSTYTYALAVQPDGSVIAGGGRGFSLTRLRPDGTPDPSFGTVGTVTGPITTTQSTVRALTILPDGKLIAAGFGGIAKYNLGAFPVTVLPAPAVVARHVFYNGSSFDNRDENPNAADDGAIATDKRPLLPGQPATFSNITSYSKGITGVMFDVAGNLPLTLLVGIAGSAQLTTGTGGDPATWADAPRPSLLGVRPGAGVNGSDRVTLTWPDGAIKNTWLRVSLSAPPQYNFPPDTFTFGNLIGEVAEPALNPTTWTVTSRDALTTRLAASRRRAPVTSPTDHNRDGVVNILDHDASRRNAGKSLSRVTGPPVPAPPLTSVRAPSRPPRRSILQDDAPVLTTAEDQ